VTPFKSIAFCLPILLLSLSVTTPAQTVGFGDKPGSIRSATEAAVGDASKTLEEATETVIPETSVLEKMKLDPESVFELLQLIDPDEVSRGKYVASIKLNNPLKPSFSGKRGAGGDSQVLFGLRRPYYRLDEKVRVVGSFDLKASGTLAGLGNSATFTFRYDFRGDMEKRAFKLSMLIDQISYRILIPF
jgi:hypothetical protein